jgi:hypothetical protein
MLFFPLFLLGRSRNLHERGGGRGDRRLLLFRLLGFTVATNLTFRHRNSPLRRLVGCEHCITRRRLFQFEVGRQDQTTGDKKVQLALIFTTISLPHLFRSYDRIRLTG